MASDPPSPSTASSSGTGSRWKANGLDVDTTYAESLSHLGLLRAVLCPGKGEQRLKTPREEDSVRMLGLEIGRLPRRGQYLVLTAVFFFFTLLYGYLQELVVVNIFDRGHGLFLTLCQFGMYTGFSAMTRTTARARQTTNKKLPWKWGLILAVMQAMTQACSTVSLRYLNYPAKVLFKASRVAPTMALSVVFLKRRYPVSEYAAVGVMVTGLLIFMHADAHTSPEFNMMGVFFISSAVVIDACTLNTQEHLYKTFRCSEDDLIFYAYTGGSCLLLVAAVVSGEIFHGIKFVSERPHVIFPLILYALTGFAGVSCVAALTKRFGALTAAITTTARKGLTLLLSFILFPKPFSATHFVGCSMFMAGLVFKATRKKPAKERVDDDDDAGAGDGLPLLDRDRGDSRKSGAILV